MKLDRVHKPGNETKRRALLSSYMRMQLRTYSDLESQNTYVEMDKLPAMTGPKLQCCHFDPNYVFIPRKSMFF